MGIDCTQQPVSAIPAPCALPCSANGANVQGMKTLRWLSLVVVLAIASPVASCAVVSKAVPGDVVDRPDLDGDRDIAWRDGLHRKDPRPVVFVVEGDELTCSSDVNGEPGFSCPTVGCRQGCTGSPAAVHLVDILPRSQGVLCHELQHVADIRDSLATLLTPPNTFIGLLKLGDRNHKGPEWQPGGAVDQCNAVMAARGR